LALIALLACALALPATGATAAPSAGAAKKCKKGYVKKRVKGKLRCVKKARKKAPAKHRATPGLDALANPGTYKGSSDATVTTRKNENGAILVSISIVLNKGYSFCKRGQEPVPL